MIERAGGGIPEPDDSCRGCRDGVWPATGIGAGRQSVRIDPSVLAALGSGCRGHRACGVPLSGALDMATEPVERRGSRPSKAHPGRKGRGGGPETRCSAGPAHVWRTPSDGWWAGSTGERSSCLPTFPGHPLPPVTPNKWRVNGPVFRLNPWRWAVWTVDCRCHEFHTGGGPCVLRAPRKWVEHRGATEDVPSCHGPRSPGLARSRLSNSWS